MPPDLRLEAYDDALLVPTASRRHYPRVDFAVYDRHGRPVADSLLTRTWARTVCAPPDISGLDLSTLPRIEQPHLYGGPFFDHFGHFLLESLARMWAVEKVGQVPVAWSAGGPPKSWQSAALDMLGLSMEHAFPRTPVRFRRLLVPSPGFRIQGEFAARHAQFLARHRPEPIEARKVWLSRTRVARRQLTAGEGALQAALADRGWRIVHPQELSLREQLGIVGGGRVVAGLEGSAFHSAVLLRDWSSSFVLLRRGHSANYRAIADAKGIVELDLYGALAIQHRSLRRINRPVVWADRLDSIAHGILAVDDDPAALRALRDACERTHSPGRWRRESRWRVGARAHAALRSARPRVARRLSALLG